MSILAPVSIECREAARKVWARRAGWIQPVSCLAWVVFRRLVDAPRFGPPRGGGALAGRGRDREALGLRSRVVNDGFRSL